MEQRSTSIWRRTHLKINNLPLVHAKTEVCGDYILKTDSCRWLLTTVVVVKIRRMLCIGSGMMSQFPGEALILSEGNVGYRDAGVLAPVET